MLAAANNTNSGGGIGFLLIAVVAIALFSIFVRRANARRATQASQVQSAATIGSEVMTGSGLYGTVVGQDDEQVLLEIAPGVQVRFAKAAIARVITPEDSDFDTPGDESLPKPPEEPGGPAGDVTR